MVASVTLRDAERRELTTSREENEACFDYPEARRKKTKVKEEDKVKPASTLPKAAIEREKRDACISISEREQARRSQS